MGRHVRRALGRVERHSDDGGRVVNEGAELFVLLLGLVVLGVAAGLYLATGEMP